MSYTIKLQHDPHLLVIKFSAVIRDQRGVISVSHDYQFSDCLGDGGGRGFLERATLTHLVNRSWQRTMYSLPPAVRGKCPIASLLTISQGFEIFGGSMFPAGKRCEALYC